MKQITLIIPDREYNFFMKLISNFSFVKVAEENKNILNELESKLTPAKLKLWNEIKEGLEEVKLIETSKKKAKTAKEFLDEL
jgi:hypothetical protein